MSMADISEDASSATIADLGAITKIAAKTRVASIKGKRTSLRMFDSIPPRQIIRNFFKLSCVESAQAEPFRYDSITMAGLGGLPEASEPQPPFKLPHRGRSGRRA